jgi:hypothetical protein
MILEQSNYKRGEEAGGAQKPGMQRTASSVAGVSLSTSTGSRQTSLKLHNLFPETWADKLHSK